MNVVAIILLAAVPLCWTGETSRVQSAVFDFVRGETAAIMKCNKWPEELARLYLRRFGR